MAKNYWHKLFKRVGKKADFQVNLKGRGHASRVCIPSHLSRIAGWYLPHELVNIGSPSHSRVFYPLVIELAEKEAKVPPGSFLGWYRDFRDGDTPALAYKKRVEAYKRVREIVDSLRFDKDKDLAALASSVVQDHDYLAIFPLHDLLEEKGRSEAEILHQSIREAQFPT